MTNPHVTAANTPLPRRSRFSTAVAPNISTNDDDTWGLPPGIKTEATLRVGFQNLGGLPETLPHPKNKSFVSFVLDIVFF